MTDKQTLMVVTLAIGPCERKRHRVLAGPPMRQARRCWKCPGRRWPATRPSRWHCNCCFTPVARATRTRPHTAGLRTDLCSRRPASTGFFRQYIRSSADRDDWRFAPLDAPDAPDLEGVAPVWLGLAECDPLVDEGLMYADRLRAAGVPVDLEIYRGMTHEFIKMGRVIDLALQAHADAARALEQAFNFNTPK